MTALLERFAPRFDAVETHRLEIDAPKAVVYDALWTADFGASPVIRFLGILRSLPAMLFSSRKRAETPERIRAGRFDLRALSAAGFGKLEEDKPNEVVFGVSGRFWRPVGNVLPFRREEFSGPVPVGTARGIWNFALDELPSGATLLTTETRVVCGDAASRRKFLAYWMLIRPFSGWIRLVMLRAVAREAALRNSAKQRSGTARSSD